MNPQHSYFELAYRTGSDLWSHIAYQDIAMELLPPMPADSMVLDVGAGRGLFALRLVDAGYKVLGLDYVPNIVDAANKEVKLRNISERARFVTGDATDIPFTDDSFDAVVDIGLLQHLHSDDWAGYLSEVRRVLKPGGYILFGELSRETPRFLGFTPMSSGEAKFEKFGVSYSFFDRADLVSLLNLMGCDPVRDKTVFFDARSDPGDRIGMIFMVGQKRQ
jgi:ubiquinone/menaquinone biosynthesis C-methylase UbiE